MENVNQVTIAGHLVKSAELRYTTTGRPVASFVVATNKRISEEKQIVDSMLASFQGSPKMAKHMELLMKKGSMYKVYNHHLLFHGCIPLKPSGEFQPLVLHQAQYAGKELLDFFEYHIRLAAKNKEVGGRPFNGFSMVLLARAIISSLWEE